MKALRRNDEGVALLLVTLVVVAVMASVALMMERVSSAKLETDSAQAVLNAEELAQAGIDMAVKRLWADYIQGVGNTTQNWASYRVFLNELGILKNEDLNFNGIKDPEESGNGDGTFDRYPTNYDRRGKQMLPEPVEIKDEASGRVIGTVDSIFVGRYDTLYEARLTIRATATVDGVSRTAVQVVNAGGSALPHASFAILANNINCILCHAQFKSLDLQYNTDPAKYNTFNRVKMAAIDSLMVRPSEADSQIAGTLYTFGKVFNTNGSLLTANQLNSSTFKGYGISSEDGTIKQASNGAMQTVNLTNTPTNAQGDLLPNGNLYLSYKTDSLQQTDGPVPSTFPAPFPDTDGDRFVSDEEFESVLETANGAVSFQGVPGGGSLKAGVAYGVPRASAYGGSNLPASSNSALTELSSNGRYDGNLILVGTPDDPIRISGTVAVNGDLVIKGPIKGDGRLFVRGNSYIVGDVTYADSPGMYGKSCQGGDCTDNAFALVSGGSVMMGDFLTNRGVNHSANTGQQFPDHTKYSIDVRTKNKNANVTISSKTENLKYGYFDQYSVDPGQPTAGWQGKQFSFTTSELMLFNKLELDTLPAKKAADPNYRARFYGLRGSQPDKVYYWDQAASNNEEHSVAYDYKGTKLLRQHMISKGMPAAWYDEAAKHYTTPSGNWISETALRNIWYDDEMARTTTSGDKFKWRFDGLIYSNNSVFAIVRSKTRHQSNTNGKMLIRGGVISADLGVLVPEGFELLYDPRVERFLGEMRDVDRVTFTRAAFYFEPIVEAPAPGAAS